MTLKSCFVIGMGALCGLPGICVGELLIRPAGATFHSSYAGGLSQVVPPATGTWSYANQGVGIIGGYEVGSDRQVTWPVGESYSVEGSLAISTNMVRATASAANDRFDIVTPPNVYFGDVWSSTSATITFEIEFSEATQFTTQFFWSNGGAGTTNAESRAWLRTWNGSSFGSSRPLYFVEQISVPPGVYQFELTSRCQLWWMGDGAYGAFQSSAELIVLIPSPGVAAVVGLGVVSLGRRRR